MSGLNRESQRSPNPFKRRNEEGNSRFVSRFFGGRNRACDGSAFDRETEDAGQGWMRIIEVCDKLQDAMDNLSSQRGEKSVRQPYARM